MINKIAAICGMSALILFSFFLIIYGIVGIKKRKFLSFFSWYSDGVTRDLLQLRYRNRSEAEITGIGAIILGIICILGGMLLLFLFSGILFYMIKNPS